MKLEKILDSKTDADSYNNAIEMLALMTQEARNGKKEKITLLIGAGFSSTVGIPDGLKLRNEVYDRWGAAVKEELNKYLYSHYRSKFSKNSVAEFEQHTPATFNLSKRKNGKYSDPNITFEMMCSIITNKLGVERDEVEQYLQEKIEKGKKIPFGYEIIAHLISNKLIDDVISLNFDTLFEKALDEEIGKKNYLSVISDEEFNNSLTNNSGIMSVIKPHGCLSQKGSILFTNNDVKKFAQPKADLLLQKVNNSSLIIIGCSCSYKDIQELFNKIASFTNHNHYIYWIIKEHDKDQAKNIGDFDERVKLITTKKGNLNNLLHTLANKINSKEVADFDLIKLGRHEIRNFFWGNDGLQRVIDSVIPEDSDYSGVLTETVINKFLLEIIIFAVKIKKNFTEEELLACPRIINFIDKLVKFRGTIEKDDFPDADLSKLLEDQIVKPHAIDSNRYFFTSNISNREDLERRLNTIEPTNIRRILKLWDQSQGTSPRTLICKMIKSNFLKQKYLSGKVTYNLQDEVMRNLGDFDLSEISVQEQNEMGKKLLSLFGNVFDFQFKNFPLGDDRKEKLQREIYNHFHKLAESFDVDLSNNQFKHEVNISTHSGKIFVTVHGGGNA